MTTKIVSEGVDPKAPVNHISEAADLIALYSKTPENFKIGMEYERLGVYPETGEAVPFDGYIERALEFIAHEGGWERGFDRERLIYLEKDAAFITLEPGGQTEYSSAPAETIGGLFRAMEPIRDALDRAAEECGFIYLGLGYQPFSRPEEIGFVPKRRYDYMGPYLKSHGRLAHEMMKMTAGIQVALDYSDDKDAMRKLRAASLCTPIAQAIFAASGIREGKPIDHLCWRGQIWNETDPSRCGIPAFFFDPNADLLDYAEWIGEMPLMFLERDGDYRESHGSTLNNLIEAGTATVYDVELALTQAFPEVRLKHFIEIRSIDAPQPHLVSTVPCFWSSLLYGDLDAIFDLLGDIGPNDFNDFRNAALKDGLKGRFRRKSIAEWALELVDIASHSSTCDDSMARLRRHIEAKMTPAEAARDLLAELGSPGEFVRTWNEHEW